MPVSNEDSPANAGSESLLRHIRYLVARRSSNGDFMSEETVSGGAHPLLSRAPLHKFSPEIFADAKAAKGEPYTLADFEGLDHATLIETAYFAFLKRPPDSAGRAAYLQLLDAGVHKLRILSAIRFSSEGRQRNTPVGGLLRHRPFARVFELPLIGRVARRLDKRYRSAQDHRTQLQRSIEEETGRIYHHLSEMCDSLDRRFSLVDTGQQAIQVGLDRNRKRLERVEKRVDVVADLSRKQRDDFDARFDQIFRSQERDRTELSNKSAAVEAKLVVAERSLAAIEAARNRKHTECAADGRLMETFYTSFQERFRGDRAEIKQRVAEHLHILQSAQARTQALPIVDIGCGRGELLEVLSENGIKANGVDTNLSSVEACQQQGLSVERSDGLEYLHKQGDTSLGGVVALHVIEHLPFATLIRLLNEAHRALAPGGVLLLETPNPGNVLVGAHNFYFDPTHRHPLPAGLMQLALEACGFTQVEILPLHAYPEELHITGGELAKRFNEYFYGPQDYAVVGRK